MYDNSIIQYNKEDYIPRDKFIRYLSKLFLRNNLQAIKKITNEIATELGITEFDFFLMLPIKRHMQPVLTSLQIKY